MNNAKIGMFSVGLLILLLTATQACATTVSLADETVEIGGTVTIPIMVNEITDYGGGTINIEYDPSVVHVTAVMSSPDSQVAAYNPNNTMGLVRISASNVYGASGDIAFANVEFTAVETGLTPLDLDVVSLYDRSFNKISATISDGSLTTGATDPAPYLVTYTISNTTISPNGDGITDDTEIDLEFSEPVDAAILIENAAGVVMKLLYADSDVTYPDAQRWDGRDSDGNIVADGTYHVNVTMDNGVTPLVYDNTRSITVANMSVATISIGTATASVPVPITIENGVNVGVCDITLAYDATVVTVTNVTCGDLDVTMANLEHVDEGFMRIGAVQTENMGLNGDITLASVTLESTGNISDTCTLNLSVTALNDATPQCNEILYIVHNGTFVAVLNGDVNGDNMVDMRDVMYLAKHVLGIAGFEDIIEEAADINGDGEISFADVTCLAERVLEIG